MIIVISPEQEVENEHVIIQQLFENGLECFHVRKYALDVASLKKYIEKIENKFRARLVLCTHFQVAENLDIRRLHFSEQNRLGQQDLPYKNDYSISTSVHSIAAFNTLSKNWDYAFVSPVFPSISKKGYGVENSVFKELKERNHPSVKLIGLGGVDENNFQKLRENGADGGALLGSIWQNKNPLKTFRKCRQTDLSF